MQGEVPPCPRDTSVGGKVRSEREYFLDNGPLDKGVSMNGDGEYYGMVTGHTISSMSSAGFAQSGESSGDASIATYSSVGDPSPSNEKTL